MKDKCIQLFESVLLILLRGGSFISLQGANYKKNVFYSFDNFDAGLTVPVFSYFVKESIATSLYYYYDSKCGSNNAFITILSLIV